MAEPSPLLEGIDPERVPRHVGLILDGNGRWANERGLPRTAGHAAGEVALFDTIEGAIDLGIEWVTAFTFSTENWSRSEDEVEFLMWFNEDVLVRRRDALHALDVRIWFAGEIEDPRVPEHNQRLMRESRELTKHNKALDVVFAFNYGSRTEIVRAARKIAEAAAVGDLRADEIDESVFSSYLYVPEMPDVDLVIRSSGEHRLSNFMLWQAAYAELDFPGVLWPDFDRYRLAEAVAAFQQRNRRFGGAVDTPAAVRTDDR